MQKTRHTQPVPMIVSVCEVFIGLSDTTAATHSLGLEKNNKIEDVKKVIIVWKRHKVIIIGDSHVRGCVTEVSQNLGETFDISGFVMPGTGLEVITSTAKEEINIVIKDDVVVLGQVQML